MHHSSSALLLLVISYVQHLLQVQSSSLMLGKKKKELNMIHSSADWTKDTGGAAALWRKNSGEKILNCAKMNFNYI